MLDGELAVPCKLQSAIAVSNTILGLYHGWLHGARSVDIKVLCNVILWTVSELDRSSTKQALACATGKLWRSHLRRFRFGDDYRRWRTVFLYEVANRRLRKKKVRFCGLFWCFFELRYCFLSSLCFSNFVFKLVLPFKLGFQTALFFLQAFFRTVFDSIIGFRLALMFSINRLYS